MISAEPRTKETVYGAIKLFILADLTKSKCITVSVNKPEEIVTQILSTLLMWYRRVHIHLSNFFRIVFLSFFGSMWKLFSC